MGIRELEGANGGEGGPSEGGGVWWGKEALEVGGEGIWVGGEEGLSVKHEGGEGVEHMEKREEARFEDGEGGGWEFFVEAMGEGEEEGACAFEEGGWSGGGGSVRLWGVGLLFGAEAAPVWPSAHVAWVLWDGGGALLVGRRLMCERGRGLALRRGVATFELTGGGLARGVGVGRFEAFDGGNELIERSLFENGPWCLIALPFENKVNTRVFLFEEERVSVRARDRLEGLEVGEELFL